MALEDSLGLIPKAFLIPLELFQRVVRHFDGTKSLTTIRAMIARETGQAPAPGELKVLVDRLDKALVLEGPAFASYSEHYARETTRPPAFAGRSYPAGRTILDSTIDGYFRKPGGAGSPVTPDPLQKGSLRAVLSPHIDFGRGGLVYSHAYRELAERSDGQVFVIVGVAHQHCRHRFALTRKDFHTPLGVAKADRDFIGRVADVAGRHLFRDELAHRTEHSIEFQVVFLQHVLATGRDFTIVPILVGSFQDLMERGVDPIDDPEVARMIEALRMAEAASGKRVVYIGGIDLCHVGPDFGDPGPVDDPLLGKIREFDRAMLDRATDLDASGWFATAAAIRNRWRVCGLAATYTLLKAIGPARGRLLGYDQAVDPSRKSCVSFASVAFDAPHATARV